MSPDRGLPVWRARRLTRTGQVIINRCFRAAHSQSAHQRAPACSSHSRARFSRTWSNRLLQTCSHGVIQWWAERYLRTRDRREWTRSGEHYRTRCFQVGQQVAQLVSRVREWGPGNGNARAHRTSYTRHCRLSSKSVSSTSHSTADPHWMTHWEKLQLDH